MENITFIITVLFDYRRRYLSGASVWIGLKRASTSFTWTDGTKFSYSNVVPDYTIYQGKGVASFR